MTKRCEEIEFSYRSIANWPFFLRAPLAFGLCVSIASCLILVAMQAGQRSTLSLSTLLLLPTLIQLLVLYGAILFVPATIIAEYFEIRNLGYYLVASAINAHGILLFVAIRVRGEPLGAYTFLDYLTSFFAIVVCIVSILLGSLYWLICGKFAKRSWWFAKFKPHPVRPVTWRDQRVY